jgi:hypothetical protein
MLRRFTLTQGGRSGSFPLLRKFYSQPSLSCPAPHCSSRESLWSRHLGLFVGHSAYAQVIVRVISLGGMCTGAAIAARYTERIMDPRVRLLEAYLATAEPGKLAAH